MAVFTLLPLAHVGFYAYGVGLDVAREQLIRPRIGLLLVNTVALVTAGVG